jgi:IS1 family transposase
MTNQIPEETKDLVNKLLLERLSLEGICRVTGVSQTWLMGYIAELYKQVPEDLNLVIPENVEGVLLTRVEADEMWSFVGHKGNRAWIWLALDTKTKQVIACHIGGRDKKDAKMLWDLIPEVYKNDADFYTDLLEAYQGAIPKELHYPSKKKVAKQA